MKINGIGYLSKEGEFKMHKNILESFSIFDDTILFGMFYPHSELPSDLEQDAHAFYPFDFVITPIPYKLWNRSGRVRFKIRGSRQAEAIRKISKILKDYNITLLNSFSNRSSHSYSTWDSHIAFEKLDFSFLFDEMDFRSEVQIKGKLKNLLNGIGSSPQVINSVDEIVCKIKGIEEDKIQEKIYTYLSNLFDEEQRIFSGIKILVEKLKSNLLEKAEIMDLLYNSNEESHKESIIVRVNSGLHFFYNKSNEFSKIRQERRKNIENNTKQDGEVNHIETQILFSENLNDQIYDFMFEQFTLRYTDGHLRPEESANVKLGSIVSKSAGKISNILYLAAKFLEFHQFKEKPNETIKFGLQEIDSLDDILPALTFVEGDSHFLNFRIAIVPKKSALRFVKLNVYYHRMNNPYSSRGLLNSIIESLPVNFRLWKYHNRLFECRDTYGSGKLSFFLEDLNRNVNYEIESNLVALEEIINGLNKKIEFANNFNSRNGQMAQVSTEKTIDDNDYLLRDLVISSKAESLSSIIRRIFETEQNRSAKYKFDVFISHSSIDTEEAGYISEVLENNKLKSYLSSKSMMGGDIFSDEIRNALESSREICLVLSPNSINSKWVTTEWGAAWAMRKRITPILLDLSIKEISSDFERLRNLHYIKYRENELEKYARDVFNRRFYPFK